MGGREECVFAGSDRLYSRCNQSHTWITSGLVCLPPPLLTSFVFAPRDPSCHTKRPDALSHHNTNGHGPLDGMVWSGPWSGLDHLARVDD